MATFMPGERIGQVHGTHAPDRPGDRRRERARVRDVPPCRGPAVWASSATSFEDVAPVPDGPRRARELRAAATEPGRGSPSRWRPGTGRARPEPASRPAHRPGRARARRRLPATLF